jgi:hypothetical protein
MSGQITEQVRKAYWNPVRRLDISGVKNQIVRFTKLDTPILTGQRIMGELRENLRN